MLYMVFKSELGVKNQVKEFGFLCYFNRHLSQKDVVVVGCFYTALVSTLEQTHCARM